MSSLTQRTPKVKPVRTVRVAVGPSEDNPYSIIVIRQGNTWDDYAERLYSIYDQALSRKASRKGVTGMAPR